MLKRSENKKIAPGLWACIGGHVEADEYINPEISCLREISEETGITVGQVDNLRLRYILIRQKGAEINQHYIFFGESSTRNIAQCEEDEPKLSGDNESKHAYDPKANVKSLFK